MFYKYNGTLISFEFRGKGETNVFLHGWGQSKECFDKVTSLLPKAKWLKVDFPPFGQSGEVEDWTLFTYANMLISLCEHLKIKKCNLIGHSFGGRVAILIAALRPELVDKLVLIASAGMRPKRRLSYYFKIWKFKCFKLFGILPENAGSADYQALPAKTRSTFVSIVNTYLEEYCPLISAKTLIIFGEKDEVTPIYMGRRLNRLIKGSRLAILNHSGHFCFEERPLKVSQLISDFLKEET